MKPLSLWLMVIGLFTVLCFSGCEESTITDDTNGKTESVFTVFRAQDGLADDFITDITVDYIRNGVWFATRNGITFYANVDSSLYTFGAEYDIPDMEATSIVIDYTGTVWAGTVSGVAYLAIGDTLWTSFPDNMKLVHRYVTAITPMSDFSLWFGTKGGISVLTSQGWKEYTTQIGPSVEVTSIARDADGRIWVGTTNGLSMFDGSKWVSYGQKELASTFVNVIFNDAVNRVWCGTSILAAVNDKGVWTRYGQADGLTSPGINDFTQDSAGTIWAATDGGVYFFINNKWTSLTLPQEVTGAVVTSIAADKKNGILWIGTISGAIRYKSTTK